MELSLNREKAGEKANFSLKAYQKNGMENRGKKVFSPFSRFGVQRQKKHFTPSIQLIVCQKHHETFFCFSICCCRCCSGATTTIEQCKNHPWQFSAYKIIHRVLCADGGEGGHIYLYIPGKHLTFCTHTYPRHWMCVLFLLRNNKDRLDYLTCLLAFSFPLESQRPFVNIKSWRLQNNKRVQCNILSIQAEIGGVAEGTWYK